MKSHPRFSASGNENAASGEVLYDLLAEFGERIRAGERISFEQFITEHPDYGEALQRLLPLAEILIDLPQPSIESVSADSVDIHPVTRTLGDYRIIREVGRGGMGIVYEAQQISLDRRVALKVLPLASLLSDRQVNRFKNEARAAASLMHPNIVSVHGVGCERSVHFYAMELIDGCDFASVIRQVHGQAQPDVSINEVFSATMNETAQVAKLSTQRTTKRDEFYRSVARLGMQAAGALHHAHQEGVLHRDIKPGNLLLDRNSNVHITDFGLARIQTGDELTLTGDLVGTLRYIPPEQVSGHHGDARSDLYSLGLTLYELVSGTPAYPADSRQQLLKSITEHEPISLAKLDSGVPRDLRIVIEKAMAKVPSDRYRDAKHFADDLTRFVESRTIKARQATRLGRMARFAKRNRLLAFLTSLLLALMAFVTVSSCFIAWNASIEASHERSASYARDMQFAQLALDDGLTAEARATLNRWLPTSEKRDVRGWEWHFLSQKADRFATDVVIRPGTAGADCVRFTPDGTSVFAGHFGSRLSLFELKSKNRIWATRRPNSSVDAMSILPKRNELAAIESDGTLSFWDLDDNQLERSWQSGITKVGSFSASDDGHFVAISARGANGVDVLDLETSSRVESFMKSELAAAVFAADCLILVGEQSIQTRAIDSWDILEQVENPHRNVGLVAATATHLAYSHSDQNFEQSRVEIWSLSPLNRMVSFDVFGKATAMSFSPTGETLAIGDSHGVLQLFTIDSEFAVARERLHAATIDDLDFSADGRSLVTTSRDTTIRVWDVASLPKRNELRGFGPPSAARLCGVGFIGGGKQVCSVDSSGAIRAFRVDDQTKVNEFVLQCKNSDSATLRASRSGNLFAVLRMRFPSQLIETQAAIYDAKTGEKRLQFELPNGSYRGSMAFSWDERLLAVGARDEVVVRSTASDKVIATVPLEFENRLLLVKTVAFSKDDQFLYCSCNNGYTAVVPVNASPAWTPDRWVKTHSDEIMSSDVSPDGKYLALVGFDRRVTLWRLPSLQRAATTFAEANEPLLHVRFSPDGNRLLTTSKSGTAALWCSNSGRRMLALRISDGWLDTGCFSPDGKALLLASEKRLNLLTLDEQGSASD